jgi:hypothetical protein
MELPAHTTYELEGKTLQCVTQPIDDQDWDALIAAGCPGAQAQLGLALGEQNLLSLFTQLGFYQPPAVPLEIHSQLAPAELSTPGAAATGQDGLLISPLQMALAAAALSNAGEIPPAELVLAIEDSNGNWQPANQQGEPIIALDNTAAMGAAQRLANSDLQIWEYTARASGEHNQPYTWYLAGTLPAAGQPARVVVILLESYNAAIARTVGRSLILDAMNSQTEE